MDIKQAIQKRNLYFVYCVLCNTKLKYCRNTTNHFTHFKGQHPLIYVKSELSQQKFAAGEPCSSMRHCSTYKEDGSQWTLNEMFQTTAVLPANSRQAMDITNAIGYFMAKDMLPISTTNGIRFKRLLHVYTWTKICCTTLKNFYWKDFTCNVH